MTLFSPTSRSWWYPTTFASVFLSSSFRPLPSPSLFYQNKYYSSSLPNTRLIPLQPTFLHFLYFSKLRCPSNSFIPNSAQLGDSTKHPRQHHHFHHIQLHILCCLRHRALFPTHIMSLFDISISYSKLNHVRWIALVTTALDDTSILTDPHIGLQMACWIRIERHLTRLQDCLQRRSLDEISIRKSLCELGFNMYFLTGNPLIYVL